MKIESPAFSEGEGIPVRHTFEAEDISPPLSWSDVPAGSESLALIVEDSDAVNPTVQHAAWLHWLLYNIPPVNFELPENMTALLPGSKEGLNDWKRTGYFGPRPSIDTHRYFFRILALDTTLHFARPPLRSEFEAAIAGHVLAEATLMGRFGGEYTVTRASGYAQTYGARRSGQARG